MGDTRSLDYIYLICVEFNCCLRGGVVLELCNHNTGWLSKL